MKNNKLAALSIFILLTGGCATKQFVQEELTNSNAKINSQMTDNNAKINASINQIKEKIEQIDGTLKLFQKEAGELKEEIIKGLEIERDMLKNKLTHVENTLKTFKKELQPVAPANETANDTKQKSGEGVAN